ncbi:MAG: GntR family transcriptional regulator [Microbacteriaceae bacterium]|uniref:GntR family transcriptional regulator n=1 Tax=Microbacterium sp. TaxID=51671 RepID=UPI003F987C06
MTAPPSGSTTTRLREIVTTVAPGELLPSERTLAAQLGVARMTVRSAIEALAREGLVRTRPGVGTERLPAAVRLSVGLRSFAGAVREHGLQPSSRLLHLADDTERPREVGSWFGLADDEPLVHLRRIRLGDDHPLALEETWLSPDLVPDLDRDLAIGSLYDLFAQRELRPTDGVELVTASLPNQAEIDGLGISTTLPVLRLTRQAFVGTTPLEFARVTFPADQYELSFPLTTATAR